MKLLDNKKNNKLSFSNEVNSLEFVELIGDMDINDSENNKKIEVMTQDEINKILTTINDGSDLTKGT